MKRLLPALSLLICLFLAAAGCSSALPTLTIAQIPWPDDEVTTYTVQDAEGSAIGTLELTIQRDDGTYTLTQVVDVTIEGQQVQDTVSVTASATDLKPLSMTETVLFSGQTIEVVATYSEGEVAIVATVDGEEQSATIAIPEDAYDDGEVLFLLRAIPFQVGYRATYTDVVPAAGLMPEATVSVAAEEAVEVPAGSFDCYKVELTVLGTTQYLWYDTESPHYLVKVEVEGTSMVLTETATP